MAHIASLTVSIKIQPHYAYDVPATTLLAQLNALPEVFIELITHDPNFQSRMHLPLQHHPKSAEHEYCRWCSSEHCSTIQISRSILRCMFSRYWLSKSLFRRWLFEKGERRVKQRDYQFYSKFRKMNELYLNHIYRIHYINISFNHDFFVFLIKSGISLFNI